MSNLAMRPLFLLVSFGMIGMLDAGPCEPSTVTLGEFRETGNLPREQIDAAVRAASVALVSCDAAQRRAQPDLTVSVEVQFFIDNRGAVSRVKTSGPTALAGCVTDVFSKLKFPAPKGGGAAMVSYPIEFHPARCP